MSLEFRRLSARCNGIQASELGHSGNAKGKGKGRTVVDGGVGGADDRQSDRRCEFRFTRHPVGGCPTPCSISSRPWMTYFAVRISGKPADEEHHYGHGKVESVSALAETALLFVLSGIVVWEALQRLFDAATRIRSTRPSWAFGRHRRSRSWSIFSARDCSIGWRPRPRARRWKPMPCTSAPTCGRRWRF